MVRFGSWLLCFLFGHIKRNKLKYLGLVWHSEPWCDRCERWI